MYSFGSEHIKGSLFLIFHNFFSGMTTLMTSPFTAIQSPFSTAQSYAPLTASAKWEMKTTNQKNHIPKKNIFSKYNISVSYKIFAIFHIRIFSLKSAWTVLLAAFWTKTLFALCVTLSFIQNINTFVEHILEIVFWVRLTSNKNEILEEIKCAQLS